MSRRQRHLNPASAGAVMAFDARFVTGLASGDPVDTWASRRPATVDATGSGTSRPLWTTGLQGGQPGLVFDGSNDQLTTSQILDDPEMTLIACFVKSGVLGTGNRDVWGTQAGSNGRILRAQLTLQVLQPGGSTLAIVYAANAPYVHTSRFSSAEGQTRAWLNGAEGTPVAYHLTASGAGFRVGYGGSLFFLGEAFSMAAFQLALSPALRRRFEQSMAFSFRIPIQ